MVSIKRFIKAFQAFACLMALSSAALCAISTPDLDIEIKECEGSYESRVMCERTLGDGSTQTGSGWCTCSRGKLSGGCSLSATTYTEKRVNLKNGDECRDCSVPGVTRGCGLSAVVDETPTCGNWYSCGTEPEGPMEIATCQKLGHTQYKSDGECETLKRTCCPNAMWSDWGNGECSGTNSCTSSQCWNGTTCEDKDISRPCSGNVANAKSGTQTRTATCTGSGWSYGSWDGACTCKTGYTWKSSGQCVFSATIGDGSGTIIGCSSVSCPSGQHVVETASGCCCEIDNCNQIISDGNKTACKCESQSVIR